jgi:wyosine [tRNA(Phe)-imidazoG37] synthetase (radical SAM superfamily)
VLTSDTAFDYLTFSGNGEPTLHPDFETIVRHIAALRDRHQPALKIALLSNSSAADRENVRRTLSLIDMPVFKLDVGNAAMFERVNRPARDVQFDSIVQSLSTLTGIHLQTVLMYGDPSNADARELASYYGAVARIKPKEVQIYSLDRPVPNAKIIRVLPRDLEEIAARGTRETGVPFHAYYLTVNTSRYEE